MYSIHTTQCTRECVYIGLKRERERKTECIIDWLGQRGSNRFWPLSPRPDVLKRRMEEALLLACLFFFSVEMK